MLQHSTEPIVGGRKIKNRGFGSRCVICGSYFDEGNICNNGHIYNETYYLPPEKPEPEKPAAAEAPAKNTAACQVYSGCHCTICGGYFADGDDICANGHQIGVQYPELDGA